MSKLLLLNNNQNKNLPIKLLSNQNNDLTMKLLLDEYKMNKKIYEELTIKINKNINGRVCHNKVVILHIICKLFNIKNYLEIGVHNGASMSYVVSENKSKNCIGIDLFENCKDHYVQDSITKQKSFDNINKNNINSTIELIKGNSTSNEIINKLKEELKDNEIDLLFIDGDHSYMGVKNDFLNYHPLVKINGLIVFDDYSEKWPNILKFVDDYIKNNNNFKILGVFDNHELIIRKINA
jgi:predicted O-methyltransferase YrrM